MIVRRSFSEACRDGDLIAIVRDLFTIRRRGQLIDDPFHRHASTEVIELTEALHGGAGRIAIPGECCGLCARSACLGTYGTPLGSP